MTDGDVYKNYEAQFLELDKKEYSFLGKQLSTFMKAMLDCGFTQTQAFELVRCYSEFIFNMGVEEFTLQRMEQWESELEDAEDDEDEE